MADNTQKPTIPDIILELAALTKALGRLEQAQINLQRELVRYTVELRIKRLSLADLDERVDHFFEKWKDPKMRIH